MRRHVFASLSSNRQISLRVDSMTSWPRSMRQPRGENAVISASQPAAVCSAKLSVSAAVFISVIWQISFPLGRAKLQVPNITSGVCSRPSAAATVCRK